ncbi:unnamed protein product [Oreochromis niloticus]|nr:unnamed protein product [Mustela putorius furo]
MPGSASLFILLCVCFGAAAAEGQKNITAATGQSTTLSCRAPNRNILVVEWSRADLGQEYVFLYRDEQFLQDNQHPSFKNRVDLQDRQMKDGDVSLILNNVTINDTGTYECRVFTKEKRLWESISNFTLIVVSPPGQPGGDTEDGGKLLRKSLTVAAKVMKLLVLVARGSQLFREMLALAARGSQLFRELLALAARGSELLMVVAKVMELLEVLDRGMVLLQDLVEVVFDLLALVF